MLCFRNREMVLDVFEKSTGNRILHGINVVGGVIRDIGPEMAKDISVFCDAMEKKCLDLQDMIVKSYTIKQRMQGTGIMSQKLAEDLCVVGPVARGSNVPYDPRATAPYLLYKEIKVTPIVEKDGDCWARSLVRVRELFQSIDIIRACLPLLDSAPPEIFTKPTVLPDGESFARCGSPERRIILLCPWQEIKRAGPREDTHVHLCECSRHRATHQGISTCRCRADHHHVRPLYRVP